MEDTTAQPSPARRKRPSGWIVAGIAVVLTVGAGALLAGRSLPGWDVLEQELRDRRDVLFLGGDDLERLTSGGTRVRRASDVPGAEAALAGDEMRAPPL